MIRHLLFGGMLAIPLLCFAGCGGQQDMQPAASEVRAENPFDYEAMEDSGQTIESAYYFGVANEDPEIREISSHDGVVDIEIKYGNDDAPCYCGIMLFVDGIIQKYHTDDVKENRTVIPVLLPEGEMTFHLYFEPETGVDGSLHQLFIANLYEPDYVAKSSNISYGNYHHMSVLLPWRLYTEDVECSVPETKISSAYQQGRVSPEAKEENDSRCKVISPEGETTEKEGIDVIRLDGKQKGKVKITLRGETQEMVTYRVSAYVNHQLLKGAFDGKDYADVKASEDQMAVLTAELDASAIERKEENTFYICYVPFEEESTEQMRLMDKSDSILLLK